MKTKIVIVLILLAGSLLTSCEQSTATVPFTPPGPNPVTVLKEQVESERELREQAELKTEEEATNKENWQLAALGLAVVTVIAFFGGTAIGSRGRHHASSTS